MEKRHCNRFNIPGTTLYYKKADSFLTKSSYSDSYFPVLDISKGGARFLTNERIEIGLPLQIRVMVPGTTYAPEITCIVRWISRNREESYRYQTGLSFAPYGNRKHENPAEILSFFESIELNHLSSQPTPMMDNTD